MIIRHDETKWSLDYRFAGQFVTDDEWVHPTRVIDSWEVMLITHGEVFLREEDALYHLKEGDMFLLRPFVEHGGTRVSHGHTTFFWAHFTTSDFEQTGLRAGYFVPPQTDRLTSAFRWLLHVANSPGYPPFAADAAMTSLLAEIVVLQAVSGVDTSRLIEEIAEWVRINSERKLTVQSVAEHFSYNPDYISALMRRSFGRGLKQYINEERLKRIKTLLMTTGLSIKELAARLGYDNENQLVHYFKYHEGISPARFRDQYAYTHMNRQ